MGACCSGPTPVIYEKPEEEESVCPATASYYEQILYKQYKETKKQKMSEHRL